MLIIFFFIHLQHETSFKIIPSIMYTYFPPCRPANAIGIPLAGLLKHESFSTSMQPNTQCYPLDCTLFQHKYHSKQLRGRIWPVSVLFGSYLSVSQWPSYIFSCCPFETNIKMDSINDRNPVNVLMSRSTILQNSNGIIGEFL